MMRLAARRWVADAADLRDGDGEGDGVAGLLARNLGVPHPIRVLNPYCCNASRMPQNAEIRALHLTCARAGECMADHEQ